MDRLLEQDEVIAITRLSRMTLYRKRRDGSFPKPVNASKRRIVWKESAVRAWIEGLGA